MSAPTWWSKSVGLLGARYAPSSANPIAAITPATASNALIMYGDPDSVPALKTASCGMPVLLEASVGEILALKAYV
jgi:hypothetical protein